RAPAIHLLRLLAGPRRRAPGARAHRGWALRARALYRAARKRIRRDFRAPRPHDPRMAGAGFWRRLAGIPGRPAGCRVSPAPDRAARLRDCFKRLLRASAWELPGPLALY